MSAEHGGFNYGNTGCRCVVCTEAHARNQRAGNERRKKRLEADPTLTTHGKVSTYDNWSCRCPDCTAANTARAALRRKARRP